VEIIEQEKGYAGEMIAVMVADQNQLDGFRPTPRALERR
jgi:hypothetical protein